MQNKFDTKKEGWGVIWHGVGTILNAESRGGVLLGIRDKQINLDKGSGGKSSRGAAQTAVGGRRPCLRGGLANCRPWTVALCCCLAALSSVCQNRLIYREANASRHLVLPRALPLEKTLPDGSDSAIRATAEPRQFLLHSLITPCLIESQ